MADEAKLAALMAKMDAARIKKGEAPANPIPEVEPEPTPLPEILPERVSRTVGDWRTNPTKLKELVDGTGGSISRAEASVVLQKINPQRDPKLPVATLFDYLDKQETSATPIEQASSRQDPLVRADAPGTPAAVEQLHSDAVDRDEVSPSTSPDPADGSAGTGDGVSPVSNRAGAAAAEHGRSVAAMDAADSAEAWAGEGRTGGWASPQRRVESWMSSFELSRSVSAEWGDVSSVAGSEKPSRGKSLTGFELASARPDSRGSIFSAESMSEQSLAIQRSTKSASWTEYCAALLRTGHCKHAAIGGVDGEVWATSPRFKKLSSRELVAIARGFDNWDTVKSDGVQLAGMHFEIVAIDASSMSGRLAPSSDGGGTTAKRGGMVTARAKTGVVVGVYDEYMVATSCAEQVMKVAEHMKAFGL